MDYFMYGIAFILIGILLVILSVLFIWAFRRDSETGSKIISNGFEGIKKADNEFISKKEAIDKETEQRIIEVKERGEEDRELIERDPLEYIRRRF